MLKNLTMKLEIWQRQIWQLDIDIDTIKTNYWGRPHFSNVYLLKNITEDGIMTKNFKHV